MGCGPGNMVDPIYKAGQMDGDGNQIMLEMGFRLTDVDRTPQSWTAFFQINLKEGVDRARIEVYVKEAFKKYPQFKRISGQQYFDKNAAILDLMFASMDVLVLFPAIASVIAMISTLATSV